MIDRFHAGRVLLAFGRKLVDDGLCGLDLDPEGPMEPDDENFTNPNVATLEIVIVEPFDLPEAADLDLSKAVRKAAVLAQDAIDAGRRKKCVVVIGDGWAPVPAGTRVLHVHDRSHRWRFSIELYVQSKDSAQKARRDKKALKSWKPKSKARRPELARLFKPSLSDLTT